MGDFQQHLCSDAAASHKHVRGKRNELRCIFSYCSFIAFAPAHLDLHVAPRRPTQLLEPFQKCRDGAVLALGVSADTPSKIQTSRTRCPCCARADERPRRPRRRAA